MHFLFYISETSNMMFQTELLINSILYFSPPVKNLYFSIIVNGEKSGPINKNLKLTKHKLKNNFLNKHADIFASEYHWLVQSPARWFITPKDKKCVFMDVDMIACKNLSSFFKLKENCIYGVNAIKIPMTHNEWNKLGFFNENDFKYYFNFGMLVIPSYLMTIIGNMLIDLLPIIMSKFKKYEYFATQIAFACILKKLNVKKQSLPIFYNFVDTNKEVDLNKIIFLHYITNRKLFTNLNNIVKNVEENKYTKKVNSIIKKFYNKI